MTFVTQREREPLFNTTHWSLVGNAAAEGDASLEALCQQYWQPVYVVARRAGHDVETAKDLTQGFFAKLLQQQWLKVADQEKGRFRTFLVTALKRYMVDEWRKEVAVKRGGGREVLQIDEEFAEQLEVSDSSPDALFDRHWALALVGYRFGSAGKRVRSGVSIAERVSHGAAGRNRLRGPCRENEGEGGGGTGGGSSLAEALSHCYSGGSGAHGEGRG